MGNFECPKLSKKFKQFALALRNIKLHIFGTHMYATYDKIPKAAVKSIPVSYPFSYHLGIQKTHYLPNPGTSKFNTKQSVANGMGKMGMAALTAEFLTINFGSMAVFTILKEDKTKY